MSGKVRGPEKAPAAVPVEIERKFLLDGQPAAAGAVEIWRLEQGYLDPLTADPALADDGIIAGRIRRTLKPDGSSVCTHTIKTGAGLIRSELEQVITAEQFERHWPRTAGRRLRKTRHRVRQNDLTWEIDVFQDIDLVLAEVELPSADAPLAIPHWLKPHIVREVTNDPAYTNASIAARLGLKS